MIEYSLWPRVERIGPRHYVARVGAIPCGVHQRRAPEERARDCGSHAGAQAAAVRAEEEAHA